MRSRFFKDQGEAFVRGGIFSDKSSLILDWLLHSGKKTKSFSIREVAKEVHVSVGLVHKVFKVLIDHGILTPLGLRTAKSYHLKDPQKLLKSWLGEYNILKKCPMWMYQSGCAGKAEMIQLLETSPFRDQVAFALHSAAEVHGCKNTNLQTLELYLLDPSIKSDIEKLLFLEPQERGYEVLLIKPYYKSLISQRIKKSHTVDATPLLITFLDFMHFPLRGREQAEYMLEHIPELQSLIGDLNGFKS
ncbi:MAG: hypothetical protein K940chlam9_01468 [Chlamydiae bacterium]|nr:hypothetical protein [Chlamydiota bacterium]